MISVIILYVYKRLTFEISNDWIHRIFIFGVFLFEASWV